MVAGIRELRMLVEPWWEEMEGMEEVEMQPMPILMEELMQVQRQNQMLGDVLLLK